MSYYKQQLKDFLAERVINTGSVLSIGCQEDDRKYFKEFVSTEYKTLDSNTEFKPDVLYNINREIEGGDGDLNIDYSHIENYDLVLAFELWEYIFDPMTAHRNIYRLMKPGGVYMASYPFVYGKHNPAGADFLRYTDDGIKTLLSRAGFTDIEIHPRITEKESLTGLYYGEGMRIRNDVDHEIIGWIVIAKK